MRARGFLILAAALILAVAAVFLVQNYLESQRPTEQVVQQTGPQLTQVVVARTALRYGDRIGPEHVVAVDWPQDFVPQGAFNSIDDLLVEEGRVALRDFEPNEPILASRVSGPGGRASLSTRIDQSKRAATIPVNVVLSVAGFVEPDDRVDIMLTRDNELGQRATDIVLQNVRILAVDQQISPNDQPGVPGSVTVELDPEQVQKLTLARQLGELSVALRNVSDIDAVRARSITAEDLLASEAPDEQPETADLNVEPLPSLADLMPAPQPAEPAGEEPSLSDLMPAPAPVEPEQSAEPAEEPQVPQLAVTPEPTVVQEPETQPVVVARVKLAFGARVGAQHLMVREWPVDSLPEGTFRQPEELLSDLPRKVLQPIEPNEPILTTDVTVPGGRATLSAMLEEQLRAVTIPVNEIDGVAGFVKPDDRVDVILSTASEEGGAARILLQNMRVMGVDQTVTNEDEEPQVVGTVTLEANPTQAKKLILARQVGNMSLLLRSTGDGRYIQDQSLTVSQLFTDNGAPVEVDDGPAVPVNPMASIKMFRGLTSSTTSVPKE